MSVRTALPGLKIVACRVVDAIKHVAVTTQCDKFHERFFILPVAVWILLLVVPYSSSFKTFVSYWKYCRNYS